MERRCSHLGPTWSRISPSILEKIEDNQMCDYFRRKRSRGFEFGDRVGVLVDQKVSHPEGNPVAIRWFLMSTPIQTPPESGGICERLTSDWPLGCLQGNFLHPQSSTLFAPCAR